MNNRASFTKIVDDIQTSFWFIPSIMVWGSIVTALLCTYLDQFNYLNQNEWLAFLGEPDRETLRSMVNTIAGSMITVTSIAFSITIVTLTVASSQFGPRLIRNFMDDTGTQVVLGTFIANFSYCIVFVYILSLQSSEDNPLLLSTMWCLLATLFSVVVLIYFIHHVARSIQADNVIDDVYGELCSVIAELEEQVQDTDKALPQPDWIKQQYPSKQDIPSDKSGYLQLLDRQSLCQLAEEHDVMIQFSLSPGDMLAKGTVIATLYSKDRVADSLLEKINDLYICGSSRTPIQDPEYAIHQMVEIAVRALSPSMNDPYTAITCVDKLSVTLCRFADLKLHDGYYYDKQQQPRLICKTYDFESLANASFDQIRQYGVTSVAVTLRLLESLTRLVNIVPSKPVCAVATSQLQAIEQLQRLKPFCRADQDDFDQSVEQLTQALADARHGA